MAYLCINVSNNNSNIIFVGGGCWLQIVAEGANGPTTPDADKIFLERNIMVIPVRTLLNI